VPFQRTPLTGCRFWSGSDSKQFCVRLPWGRLETDGNLVSF